MTIKWMKLLTVLGWLAISPVQAEPFSLATTIERGPDSVTVSAMGYTRLNLVRLETSRTGTVYLHGKVSVTGLASIVMWAKVDGAYYFSKLPGLQGIRNTEDLSFAIPFTSPEKPITELVLEVELPEGGGIRLSDLSLADG